ncbi:NUDIX domain-containing protein [Nocardioides sp.]|uniref:NUDIX domain-containing protein n=1 Tax=Nocardioides sp. TaxID=35761 RepID=UPI0039E38FC3
MTVDRFVVVPAAYVFLLRPGAAGDEVLLQLRGDVPYMAGHWAAAAAGHVERGETAYAAALREAREELGLTAVGLEFATTMQRHGSEQPIDQRVDFFFTARSWAGEPELREPEKAHDLGWFRLDALPEPLVPHEAAVLAGLREGGLAPYISFGF